MKKKMILLFIFVLTMFVGFNRAVADPEIEDYTNSGSGVSGFGKEGGWNPISGFRVVILDENGNKVAGTERINVTNGKVIEEGILQYVPSSKSNYGKTNYKTVKITTNSYSKVEYIKKGVVNSRTNFTKAISKSNVYYWADITGLEEFGNYLNNEDVIKVDGVDSYLEKNNYKNLKLMMEAAKYTCFSNKPNQQQCKDAENHYVSVEPLTLIYRDLGTAFELGGRPWLVGGECTKNSGCWYGGVYLNMHNSLLINQNKDFFDAIKGGNSTLSVKQGNEAYKRINSNRVVGMGIYKITDIGEIPPPPTLGCDSEIAHIEQNFSGEEKKLQLIALYKWELAAGNNYNKLLYFDEPSCGEVTTCTNNSTSSGCLEANFQPSTPINENNLSCYTNTIDVSGNTAFCQVSLGVSSYVGTGPFSSKAGQMYIKSSNGKAVNSNLTMKCYLPGSTSNVITNQNTGGYSEYIKTIKFNNQDLFFYDTSLELKRGIDSRDPNAYIGTATVDYYFKKLYSNNITGEVEEVKYSETSSCSNCKYLGYGKISKLTDNYQNKDIPFAFTLELEDDYDFEGNCDVTVTPEIIENNKPELVFRTVNTQVTDGKNAFLDKLGNLRNPKSNWVGKEDIITNTNNSYNKNGSNPKYVIILTPDTIKKIRKDYNKDSAYDDYNFEPCKPTVDGGNACVSKFLTDLTLLDTVNAKKVLEIKTKSEIRECIDDSAKLVCDL